MQARTTLSAAAVAGFLAVALGAFGAHGLKSILDPAMMQVWQTAVQYHLVHAPVLLALGVWQLYAPNRWLSRAALLMIVGILLFSGSLYLMAVSGIRALGMITPLGGISWLIGWTMLLLAARQPLKTNSDTGKPE